VASGRVPEYVKVPEDLEGDVAPAVLRACARYSIVLAYEPYFRIRVYLHTLGHECQIGYHCHTIQTTRERRNLQALELSALAREHEVPGTTNRRHSRPSRPSQSRPRQFSESDITAQTIPKQQGYQ